MELDGDDVLGAGAGAGAASASSSAAAGSSAGAGGPAGELELEVPFVEKYRPILVSISPCKVARRIWGGNIAQQVVDSNKDL